jgi:hypothetical protein
MCDRQLQSISNLLKTLSPGSVHSWTGRGQISEKSRGGDWQRTFKNGFLASLPDDEFGLIRAHLHVVELKPSSALIEVGDPFKNVFMPYSGIISLIVKLAGGERVEIAMVGRDSLLGAHARGSALIGRSERLNPGRCVDTRRKSASRGS